VRGKRKGKRRQWGKNGTGKGSKGRKSKEDKKGTGSPYSITERTVPELSFTHKMAA